MDFFRNRNPLVQAAFFLMVMGVSMFIQHPIIIFISLIGAVLFCISLEEKLFPFGWITALEPSFHIPMFLLITITNPLFSHAGATPLFFLNGNAITLEAFKYGAALGIMLVSIMLWSRSITAVMTSDKYLYIFGKQLPKLSLILSMAMRYIPLLRKRIRTVSKAQKSLGLYTSESYFDRLRSSITVVSSIIGWSMEDAVEKSRSMKSRAYGSGKRTMYSNYDFKRADIFALIFISILFLFTLYGAFMGELRFNFYPKLSEINYNMIAIISYISYINLVLLPTIAKFGDKLRWKYYESRM